MPVHCVVATRLQPCRLTAPPAPLPPAAAHSVRTLLVSIQSLLADPNVDSPLNAHAAKMWGCTEYRQLVEKTFNSPKPA